MTRFGADQCRSPDELHHGIVYRDTQTGHTSDYFRVSAFRDTLIQYSSFVDSREFSLPLRSSDVGGLAFTLSFLGYAHAHTNTMPCAAILKTGQAREIISWGLHEMPNVTAS